MEPNDSRTRDLILSIADAEVAYYTRRPTYQRSITSDLARYGVSYWYVAARMTPTPSLYLEQMYQIRGNRVSVEEEWLVGRKSDGRPSARYRLEDVLMIESPQTLSLREILKRYFVRRLLDAVFAAQRQVEVAS